MMNTILLADSITNSGTSGTITNSGTAGTITNSGVSGTITNSGATGHTFAQIVDNIVVIVNHYIIPTMFALAFLFFLAGVARYLIIGQVQGNEEAKEKGKHLALGGIIGFVVLFGIWGIVNLFLELLTSLGGVSAH